MSMNCQITKTCQSMHYYIKHINRCRDILDFDTTNILINSLVTSKLDYCNSLLYGHPKYTIDRLQKMQNKAARVISGVRVRDHITPV